jgi:acyl-CoA dehydrogenase
VDPHGRGGLGGREAAGQWTGQYGAQRPGRAGMIHTIFEGTSEIQQLVIARAISGLRIE